MTKTYKHAIKAGGILIPAGTPVEVPPLNPPLKGGARSGRKRKKEPPLDPPLQGGQAKGTPLQGGQGDFASPGTGQEAKS